MEQERFLKANLFFMGFFTLDFCIFSLEITAGSFPPDQMWSTKLKCKVTLLVHKERNKSYISSVAFVINFNSKKVLLFVF